MRPQPSRTPPASARGAGESLASFDDAKASGRGDPASRAPSGSNAQAKAALHFDGAAVRLGHRMIWSDLTLSVASGDFVAVLGPNGVGKSTLIKAALGLVPLAVGSATVLGRAPGDAGH